jgi:hypothetical protein
VCRSYPWLLFRRRRNCKYHLPSSHPVRPLVLTSWNRRDLEATEMAELRVLKKNMHKILGILLKSEVGSLVAFKLTNETGEVVNRAQLERSTGKGNEEKVKVESTSLATTIRNSLDSTDDKISDREKYYLKARDEKLQASKVNFPNPLSIRNSDDKAGNLPRALKQHNNLLYEMYHLANSTSQKRTTQSSSSFSGLPLSLHALQTWSEIDYAMNKLPITQTEIQEFINSHESAVPNDGKLTTLLSLPFDVNSQISKVMEEKRKWDPSRSVKEWLFHSLTPLSPPPTPVKKSKYSWHKTAPNLEQPPSYIIILSTQKPSQPPGPPQISQQPIRIPKNLLRRWRG